MTGQKIISQAQSTMNGIIFCSNIFPSISCYTFKENDGKIYTKLIPTHVDKYINYPSTKKMERNHIIFSLNILLYIISILLNNIWILLSTLYFSIFLSKNLYIFAKHTYNAKCKRRNKNSTAKYHAAQHMVINAYEKMQKIPTLEEIKNFSHFSKKCNSNELIYEVANHSLIYLTIVFIPNWNLHLYFFLIIFIPIFTTIAYNNKLLIFLQKFITATPSDEELEVVIEAIKNFEKMEESLSQDGINIMVKVLSLF